MSAYCFMQIWMRLALCCDAGSRRLCALVREGRGGAAAQDRPHHNHSSRQGHRPGAAGQHRLSGGNHPQRISRQAPASPHDPSNCPPDTLQALQPTAAAMPLMLCFPPGKASRIECSVRSVASQRMCLLHADGTDMGEASVQVGIIMGSDSDLATMKAAAEVLRSFNIRAEVTVVSAHRTPDRMLEYARAAHKRGIKVQSCATMTCKERCP